MQGSPSVLQRKGVNEARGEGNPMEVKMGGTHFPCCYRARSMQFYWRLQATAIPETDLTVRPVSSRSLFRRHLARRISRKKIPIRLEVLLHFFFAPLDSSHGPSASDFFFLFHLTLPFLLPTLLDLLVNICLSSVAFSLQFISSLDRSEIMDWKVIVDIQNKTHLRLDTVIWTRFLLSNNSLLSSSIAYLFPPFIKISHASFPALTSQQSNNVDGGSHRALFPMSEKDGKDLSQPANSLTHRIFPDQVLHAGEGPWTTC